MTFPFTRPLLRLSALACTLAVAACVPHVGSRPGPAGTPEARSLFGQPLYPPELPLDVRQRLEAAVDSARQRYEANPDDADAIVAYGRGLAALGEYTEAIGLFTEGMKKAPRDARFYRYRGERWITVRRFDRATVDLERGLLIAQRGPEQAEPDVPGADGRPLTTLQWGLWYNLGIARYLRGDFSHAAQAFRAALGLARNDDARVAAADWLYMSLRRQNRPGEAAAVLQQLGPGLDVTINRPHLRLIRMYRGELPPDSLLQTPGATNVELATQGYGVGNWYLVNGRRSDAEAVFWRVVSAENWAPPGYIAAEADLRRLTEEDSSHPQ